MSGPRGSIHIFITFYLFFPFFSSKKRRYSKKARFFKIPCKKNPPKYITPLLFLATTEYNYGMAADIYDKKYNVTKCNQTFEHKKIAPNLDKLKA